MRDICLVILAVLAACSNSDTKAGPAASSTASRKGITEEEAGPAALSTASRKGITEEEACALASARKRAYSCRNSGGWQSCRNMQISGCTDFESQSDKGTARIRVNASAEMKFGSDPFRITDLSGEVGLYRTDQGWKAQAP